MNSLVFGLAVVIVDVFLFFFAGTIFYYFSFESVSLRGAATASSDSVLWRILYLQVVFQLVFFAAGHYFKSAGGLSFCVLAMFSSVLLSALIMKRGDLLQSLLVFLPLYAGGSFAAGFSALITGSVSWYIVRSFILPYK